VRNTLINASVTAALKTLREKYPGYLGTIWSVPINESDFSESLEVLCNVWSSAISNGAANSPDLILDVTITGISSSFTVAMGVPTLSAVYGQENDIREWRNLNVDQKNYLIQVQSRRVTRGLNLTISREFVKSLASVSRVWSADSFAALTSGNIAGRPDAGGDPAAGNPVEHHQCRHPLR